MKQKVTFCEAEKMAQFACKSLNLPESCFAVIMAIWLKHGYVEDYSTSELSMKACYEQNRVSNLRKEI